MDIIAAGLADLEDVQAIYAHHVLYGTGTFEEIPPSLEEMTARFQAVMDAGWGYMVAKDASGVLGFGYYGQYRMRSAYRSRLRTASMFATRSEGRAWARRWSWRC